VHLLGLPPPTLSALPASATQIKSSGPTLNAAVATVGCTDPSSNAVIRLARLRDQSLDGSKWEQLVRKTIQAVRSSPRPPLVRHTGRTTGPTCCLTLAKACCGIYPPRQVLLHWPGAMHYVELDTANLAKWFKGTIGSSGTSANNTTGYSVYFSDRRSEQPDPTPPASVGGTNVLTGCYGSDDFTNPSDSFGCPNGSLNQGKTWKGIIMLVAWIRIRFCAPTETSWLLLRSRTYGHLRRWKREWHPTRRRLSGRRDYS